MGPLTRDTSAACKTRNTWSIAARPRAPTPDGDAGPPHQPSGLRRLTDDQAHQGLALFFAID
jgi:hypothetical protein